VLVSLCGEESGESSQWWRSDRSSRSLGAVAADCRVQQVAVYFIFNLKTAKNALSPVEQGLAPVEPGDERSGFPVYAASVLFELKSKGPQEGVMKKQAIVGWVLVLCLALGSAQARLWDRPCTEASLAP